MNNFTKNELEQATQSKSIQEARTERCNTRIRFYTSRYFMDKKETYTEACYEIIVSTNKIIMQKYDFSKINELNKKISSPNFDELRRYLLEHMEIKQK